MRFSSPLALALAPMMAVVAALAGPALGAVPTKCHGKKANVIGTPGKDHLKTNDVDSGGVVSTGNGNDRVNINGVKNVTVCTGGGYDHVGVQSKAKSGIVIYTGARRDTTQADDKGAPDVEIHGEDGPDFLDGGSGGDRIYGGAGDDFIRGHGGADRLKAGGGGDWIEGGHGFDRMFGGGGNDSLFGLAFNKPARKDKADKGDGGRGSDYCQTTKRHSCGRKQRTDIPLRMV